MTDTALQGIVYYASKKAQANRLLKEGYTVTVNSHHKLAYLNDRVVQVDFDSSGTNYIHLQLTNIEE